MNAFVKKEIRLLLPSFLLAVGSALISIFFYHPEKYWGAGIEAFLGCVFCPAFAVLLALNSFGGEINAQTLSMLLAQPVTRLRIWQTKVSILAAALAIVGLIWCLVVILPASHLQSGFLPDKIGDFLAMVSLFGLVLYSGALWTVLLLRQVAAAFWFTLIVPAILMVIVIGLCGGCSDEFILGMVTVVLGTYSLAGFFFARWLFLRAQDVQWTGGTIVMPEWWGGSRWKMTGGAFRTWRPRAALWRKELQLHQSQYVIAFVLLLLHLAVLGVRMFYDVKKSPDLKFLLEAVWGLWMVLPLLVGCAAVAEERKLGIHEGQLCLPASRRTQFMTKLLVVAGLSVLFGALIPLLLEGKRILPSAHYHLDIGLNDASLLPTMSAIQTWVWQSFIFLDASMPFLLLAGSALLTGILSLYVSTLSRNTLQALAPAVLSILLACFLIMLAAVPWNLYDDFFWRGPLGFLIALPLMVVTLLWLAFGNFKQVRPGWKIFGGNLLLLVCALVLGVITTAATYHRCWEKLTRLEPRHGAARLSLAETVNLNWNWTGINVRLSDGRVWNATSTPRSDSLNPLSLALGNFELPSFGGKFVAGSNWLSLRPGYQDIVGLKDDGTLWVSEQPLPVKKLLNGKYKAEELHYRNLVPFDNDVRWTSFINQGVTVLLVKNDGTLWRWGDKNFDSRHKQWPGLRAFTPERLGTESNWAEVFQCNNYTPCFRKTDGSGWTSREWNKAKTASIEIEPDFIVYAVPGLNRNQIRSSATISHGLQQMIGIRNDGTFRIWAHETLSSDKHSSYYEWTSVDLPIGSGTNWLAVAGDWQRVVTLKDDGTLWLWDFRRKLDMEWNPNSFDDEIQKTTPVQLGTHSDWVAISGNDLGVVSLAADGSLWFWPMANATHMAEAVGIRFNNNNNDEENWLPLIDISHKPKLLGNMLDGENQPSPSAAR